LPVDSVGAVERGRRARERDGAGGVERAVQPVLAAAVEQLTGEGGLEQRFAAGEGHAAPRDEGAVGEDVGHHLARGHGPAARGAARVGVVAVEAAQRAALQEEDVADAGAVQRAERLDRMDAACDGRVHGAVGSWQWQ
jgi:hypothetical protein